MTGIGLYDPRHPSLGPNLFFFKNTLVWIVGPSSVNRIIHIMLNYFARIYLGSMVVNIIVKFDFALFINFIKFSAFPLAVLKHVTYNRWRARWGQVVETVAHIEMLTNDMGEDQPILKRYQRYSHIISYVYWVIGVSVTSFFLVVFFYHNRNVSIDGDYKDVFYVLLPFGNSTRLGRFIIIFLQLWWSAIMAAYNLGWDSLVVATMVFIAGQLKALRVRCAHALDSDDEDICLKRIYKCHYIYVTILQCQREVNSLIFLVFFVHLLSASVNYGLCIVNIVLNRDNLMEVLTNIQLLSGIGFQLLLYYLPANEVIVQSEPTSYGVFESNWVERGPKVRRATLLLGVGMQQRVAFSAGPFHDMSLATFVMILKASYSFYTLITRGS